MDDARFDQLAKALIAGASRRRVMRSVVGTALAGVVGLRTADETLARNRCRHKLAHCSNGGQAGFACSQTNPGCTCARIVGGGKKCVVTAGSFDECATGGKCPPGQVCVDFTECFGTKTHLCTTVCT
jgi:hypothetical protein